MKAVLILLLIVFSMGIYRVLFSLYPPRETPPMVREKVRVLVMAVAIALVITAAAADSILRLFAFLTA